MALVKKIVPYDMKHNSETDCTDLLMEIEHLEMLIDAVDQKCYKKVCLYLRSCVPYAPDPENTILMKTAMNIYRKFDKHCEAMVVALQLNDEQIIEDIFTKERDYLFIDHSYNRGLNTDFHISFSQQGLIWPFMIANKWRNYPVFIPFVQF